MVESLGTVCSHLASQAACCHVPQRWWFFSLLSHYNRVGFGLLLVTASAWGLAGTLTGIGLVFVYAGRLMKRQLERQPADFPALCPDAASCQRPWRSPALVPEFVMGQ